MRLFTATLTLLCIVALAFYGAIESDHAVVLYQNGLKDQAIELLKAFETHRASAVEFVGNDPGRVMFLLVDGGSLANGMANLMGNRILVFSWPSPSRFLNFEDWYPVVSIHEFTHIVHLNYTSGFPWIVRTITGVPLLDPQPRSPFVESTTVFAESQIGLGGRLNNPLIKALACAMKRGNYLPSLGRAGSPALEDFWGYSVLYHIPSQFYEYLVEKYGLEKVKGFLRDFSSKALGMGMNAAAKKNFGKDLSELYGEWIDSMDCKFEFPSTPVFLEKNSAVMKITASGKKIYALVKKYGFEALYGWGGYTLYEIDGGKPRLLRRILGGVSQLKYDSGKIYFIQRYQKNSARLPFYTSRIVELGEDGRERILAEGYISAFDVENGKLYYATYDPSSGTSKLHTPSGGRVVKGFIREISVEKGRIACLVSKDGMSSVLVVDGEELVDGRFKYSLKWQDGALYFVAFDETGANLYELNGKNMLRLTRNSAILDYAFFEGTILVVTFSDEMPAVGIYETKPGSEEKASLYKPPQKKIESVDMKEVDPFLTYTYLTLQPVIHVPVVFPKENAWEFGVALGGFSPDYSLLWVAAPLLGSDGTFDVAGAGVLSLGNLNVSAYGISWGVWGGSLDLTILKWMASSEMENTAGVFLRASNGDLAGGVNFGITGAGWNASIEGGYGKFGIDLGAAVELRSGSVILRTSVGYYGGFYASAGFRSPLFPLNIGTLDPYIDISHVFWGIDVGYDGEYYVSLNLGVEIASFLTYSRNFPYVSISYKNGLGVNFGLGL